MSGLNTTSNIEEARTQIDDHISRLKHEIHALRQRRNGLAPISRLPPELLLESFRLCRDRAISDGKVSRWIAEVTHVCQYWRNLALPACTLWAAPDFLRPVLAAEMLRRSGSSPLRVIFRWQRDQREMDSWLNGVELVASTLASEINRLRSVELRIPQQCTIDLLAHATAPAPNLERLHLVEAGIEQDWAQGGQPLPADIFSGMMPNLRTLSLTDCAFDLSHPSCANLQSLSLQNMVLPSIEHLHGVILSMKRLRELVICESIPNVPAGEYNPAPISLPNLRTLCVTDTSFRLAAFLTPLQCTLSGTGTTAALRIHCTRTHSAHPIHFILSITHISRWASRTLAVPLNALKITATSVRALPASLEFTLTSSEWPILEAFIIALPLPNVKTISASGTEKFTLGPVLAHAQGLQTLDLDRGCADNAVRELGGLVSGDVPHLQHVVLRNLRLPPNVEVLWRMLENRLPPHDEEAVATLTFHGCGEDPQPELDELAAQETRLRVWWDDRLIKRENNNLAKNLVE